MNASNEALIRDVLKMAEPQGDIYARGFRDGLISEVCVCIEPGFRSDGRVDAYRK